MLMMRASQVAALAAEAATGEPHEVMLLKLEVEDLTRSRRRLCASCRRGRPPPAEAISGSRRPTAGHSHALRPSADAVS